MQWRTAMRGSWMLLLSLSVVGLFAVACGRDDDDGASSPPSVVTSTSPTPATAEPRDERTDDLTALSTPEVIDTARHIVLATVVDTSVIEGAPGTPFTRTQFRVERLVKGSLGDTFVLQVIGGRLGDTTVESLLPEFVESNRYVLFLGVDGPVGPTIIPQILLEVVERGGDAVVRPSLKEIPVLAAGTSELATSSPSGQRLDDVLFSISQYLKD